MSVLRPKPLVEDDAAVALAKGRHLLPPGKVVATGTVGEDEGITLAVGLVVEANAVDRGFGHRALQVGDQCTDSRPGTGAPATRGADRPTILGHTSLTAAAARVQCGTINQ